MDFPPIVLLPCRILLGFAALIVPQNERTEWTSEWFAELWCRWIAMQEAGENQMDGAWQLYVTCAGCFRDAGWHFFESGGTRLLILDWVRSPQWCLGALLALLTGLFFATGFLPATRDIISPLPYANASTIAVISRTGRMEATRKGIPNDLAWQWKKKSKLITELARCSFPKPARIAALYGAHEAVAINVTENFFSTLGVRMPPEAEHSTRRRDGVWLSNLFWRTQLHSAHGLAGETLTVSGRDLTIKGVLPAGFWFLAPTVSLYLVDGSAVPPQSMLVARCREHGSPGALQREFQHVAESAGYEFATTAPHAMFVQDAVTTPLWLFAFGLFVAVVMVTIAHGSRWLNCRETSPSIRANWRWWGFFFWKTALGLLLVLLVGIEAFIGCNQQAISEALGGPALIWFYMVGCTLVLFASISDQQSRCRVCQRLLGFPIRIGCPGCLFLDWAGTEFLCPQGHGVLYVPHHVTCWEEADRWVLLEV
jgi:hypothetical protein